MSDQANRELELLTGLIQAVHKSTDLQKIYSIALDLVTSLENVDMVAIYLVDKERREAILEAQKNLPEDYIRRAGRIPCHKGITWKVIDTGMMLNVEDAQKEPEIGPAGRDLGHHGILGIPITLEERTIGVIWFFSYKERKFSEKEIKLLSTIGDQLAIAIARAKMFEEMKRQAEVLNENLAQLARKNRYEAIISTVTRSIHQSINLEEVLENAVEAMNKNIDGVDNISIYLVEGEEAVMKANRGYPDWFIKRVSRIPYPKGFTWKTIIEGRPRYVADVDQDTVIGPAGREVGTKSYLSMPIRYSGKTVGAININSLKKNAFDEEELKLLDIVAHQIEIAIGNAKAAETMRENEERYRTVTETASDAIISIDEESRILFANRAAEKVFGYTREEMLGQRLLMLMPEDLRQAHLSSIKRYIETGKRSINWNGIEFPGLHKSGRKIPLELSFSEFIKDGKRIFTGIIRDVTERKQAEERIREQAELLDKARDAIIVRDMEGRIVYWNKSAERLYGWAAEEAAGKNADRLLFKEDSPQIGQVKRDVIEKGEWIGELSQRTKQGKEIIVESRWTLVRDDDGKPKSMLIVNTDITEKKRLETQYLRSQRMESIGTLAGGIAHDLNNVLQPIMMALELLRKKLTDEQSLNWINTMETSVQRGANLVKQILSFAKGMEGEKTILQARHIILEVQKILEETFPKSIDIHTDLPRDLWIILGDPTQLHQVLMNLCVNARDAMPNGGKLSISAENLFIDENYARMNINAKVGPYIIITVSDTGSGIPPEILDRIFEPFFTTKEPDKGTGLGLSTAFGIVKDHGGFINVYSEVGKGTRFKIYLPAVETTETKEPRDKGVEEPLSGHGELILVIDDEASIRDITKVTLEKQGYRTITASDGAEGLALYVQNRKEIKAVILDIMMPIMDGLATIRALRKIDPQVKIILVSGLKDKGESAEPLGYDVDAFLPKPYKAETLLRTLRKVLSRER